MVRGSVRVRCGQLIFYFARVAAMGRGLSGSLAGSAPGGMTGGASRPIATRNVPFGGRVLGTAGVVLRGAFGYSSLDRNDLNCNHHLRHWIFSSDSPDSPSPCAQ